MSHRPYYFSLNFKKLWETPQYAMFGLLGGQHYVWDTVQFILQKTYLFWFIITRINKPTVIKFFVVPS